VLIHALSKLAALALLAFVLPALAQAPEAPKGSYLSSCYGCTIIGEGRSMTCSCTRNNGGRSFTFADLLLCESHRFSNNDGKLACDPALMAKGSEPLPAGSYKDSCHSCTRKGNRLSCTCPGTASQPVVSTLDLASCKPRQVASKDGTLACERR
jgi:hypothetical protein